MNSVAGAAPRTAASPMRFPYPSTTSDAGSDQHRVYLTQLRYVFRLSQPIDVLFRPHPSSLVSCWYRPWVFDLQRFSPRVSRQHLSMQASPRVLSSNHCRHPRLEPPEGTPTDDTLVPTTASKRRNARARPSVNNPQFMVQKHPSLRIRRPRPNTEALSRDRHLPSNRKRQ